MLTLTQDAVVSLSTSVAPSALGYLALLLQEGEVLACVFGHASEKAALRALQRHMTAAGLPPADFDLSTNSVCDRLLERLVQYAAGEDVDFSDVAVYSADRSPFQRRVLAACRAIPRGETRTYGQLARIAGSPGAARAVGRVMATNRVPLIVPCHRVVPAGGGLGGFSAPQGVAMKGRLLEMER